MQSPSGLSGQLRDVAAIRVVVKCIEVPHSKDVSCQTKGPGPVGIVVVM